MVAAIAAASMVAPLTAAASSNLAMPGLFAPAGLPADAKAKLDAACTAAMHTEAFQRVAKTTFQPADFMPDSTGFKANIEKDMVDKERLLTALGIAKK